MRFRGHYGARADIAWLRFDGYGPAIAGIEKAGDGLSAPQPDRL